MPTSIPLGAPIWADGNAPDLASELAFYTRLFGWTTFDSGEEFGHYTEFCLGTSAASARAVAGMAPNQSDQPDKPASWGVSFHVQDCVAAASQAEKLGAATITHPMRIGDDLVYANMRDPDGGVFGLFEPLNDAMGFMAYGEPGAAAWFEYVFDGVPAEAMQFYSELLDWSMFVPSWVDPDDPAPYTDLRVRESGMGFGACRAAAGPETELPPQWLVCFAVESVDRVSARALELGASVVMPPGDEAEMRSATLASPTGALFGVVAEAS
ncbi:VOC family protein [Glycomyces sp. L485]|uniref:VOC family protein n=1 Tax=Glycomyces sp. L485 TaxID=2909235 RepID=UPI001F4A74F4|nr:VOC family protein [Glycomyces sp. L485]MCH7232445.1 VOC family protein [Glycomyces sp. L485]